MRRVLVTIPHVFNPAGDARYASCQPDPNPRVSALSACLAGLRLTFQSPQVFVNHAERSIDHYSGDGAVELHIVLCTTGGLHLLDDLAIPGGWYEVHRSATSPMLVGFECHSVMRDLLGSYDFYCYLEDDIVMSDPAVIDKVDWFTRTFGQCNVLAPHRYEVVGEKLYVDGDIPLAWTRDLQDISVAPTLHGRAFGRRVTFHRPLNPHSGTFFLTAAQLEHWVSQPYFLDRDSRFVGPLESSANTGIIRTFRLYKPAPACASFFEVEHRDTKWSRWAQENCRRSNEPI